MSFNTYVTRRADLVRLCERAGLEVIATPPLEHWVEQAVNRDVLVLLRPAKDA